jgi:hypothetical protein
MAIFLKLKMQDYTSKNFPLVELAFVLVRRDHVATFIEHQ